MTDYRALADRLRVHPVAVLPDGRPIIMVEAEHASVAVDALDQLTRWRAEATEVIEGWERVWDALGRPGTLGQSKSQAVLDLLTDDTFITALCPRCDEIDAAVEAAGGADAVREWVTTPGRLIGSIGPVLRAVVGDAKIAGEGRTGHAAEPQPGGATSGPAGTPSPAPAEETWMVDAESVIHQHAGIDCADDAAVDWAHDLAADLWRTVGPARTAADALDRLAAIAPRIRAALKGTTPGPWVDGTAPHPDDGRTGAEWVAACFTGVNPLHVCWVDGTEDPTIVTSVVGDGPQSPANARLIAAAPSLLADVLAIVEREGRTDG